MTTCFMCDNEKRESQMHPESICGKRVCKFCCDTMDNTEFMTREREVALQIQTDARGRAGLDRSGGLFKRHKG